MSGEDTNGLLSFVHKVEIRKFLNLLYLHEDNAMKKIVSLLLVVVLVFTFMAVSVSAATVIQPRGTCPSCTYGYMGEDTVRVTEASYGYATGCKNIGTSHAHYRHTFENATICRNCGYRNVYKTYDRIYCPYDGYKS